MRRITSPLLALILLANSQPTENSNEIVVTAPSRDTKTLKQQVGTFVGKVSDNAEQEQFARRNDPYCVRIIGVDPSYHPTIMQRVREAANQTGAQKEAGADCRPNIVLIFSEDADKLVQLLRDRNPAIFGRLPVAQQSAIFEAKRPVRWWYGTTAKGANGEPSIDGEIHRISPSLISSGLKIDLTSTVVVIDLNQSSGYPLDSITSFASMVIFAQIAYKPDAFADTPSILGMFDRPGPRINALRRLTVWDKAYLRALYRIPADRPLRQQRSQLRGAMIAAIQQVQQE